MKYSLPLITILLTTLCFNFPVSAAKLYKWVDKEGNISYQDTPPPESAKVLEESSFERKTRDQEITNPNVSVNLYTIENCEACDELRVRLEQLEIPFEEQSLLNKEIQAEILTSQDSITAPTLKVGDTFVENLSADNVVRSLQAAGFQPRITPPPEPPATNRPSSEFPLLAPI